MFISHGGGIHFTRTLSTGDTTDCQLHKFRVLVTGPREWPDRAMVFTALGKLSHEHGELTVVHGNAYRGADHYADWWARLHGVPEPHDASWRPNGILDRVAGFKRNQAMVDAGADTCLAFLMRCTRKTCRKAGFHYTHGTWDCVTRAREAGIPVVEYYHRN